MTKKRVRVLLAAVATVGVLAGTAQLAGANPMDQLSDLPAAQRSSQGPATGEDGWEPSNRCMDQAAENNPKDSTRLTARGSRAVWLGLFQHQGQTEACVSADAEASPALDTTLSGPAPAGALSAGEPTLFARPEVRDILQSPNQGYLVHGLVRGEARTVKVTVADRQLTAQVTRLPQGHQLGAYAAWLPLPKGSDPDATRPSAVAYDAAGRTIATIG